MKAQLRLNLGALRHVAETTPSDADHFSSALALDFGGVELELQLPKAMVGDAAAPPAAWTNLRVALQELAAPK